MYIYEYLQYLYFTSHQLLFYLRRNGINGSHGATTNHCVNLRRPLTCHNIWNSSEIFRIILYINICGVWCDPKERIQANQSMSLTKLCMWTTCIPFCTVRNMFVFCGNSIGPVGIIRGRCLEKLDAVISMLLGTNDTTPLLWSLKPHGISNYKFTAWNIHNSSYELFIPLQFSDSLFRSCQFVSIKNVLSCILGHTPIVEHCLVMCSSANQR